MKRILITGANGFLGQHLCIFLEQAGYDIIATGRGESRLPLAKQIKYVSAELSTKDEVEKLLAECNPNIIIHNAALSKPDECELNREFCLKCNVESTKLLLQAAADHFIYVSTDFVFGEHGPHSEDAKPDPLNFYGETKLMSEEIVRKSGKKATIVRPVFIYGRTWTGMRPTFLHWVKNNLSEGKPIKVVSDQLRTPTYVTDICKGVQRIIEREATGTYNLAGKDFLSPYEMAIKTAGALKLEASLIENVTSETFPEPVRRAKKSGLQIQKAIRELDYDPVSFEEGIRLTFE